MVCDAIDKYIDNKLSLKIFCLEKIIDNLEFYYNLWMKKSNPYPHLLTNQILKFALNNKSIITNEELKFFSYECSKLTYLELNNNNSLEDYEFLLKQPIETLKLIKNFNDIDILNYVTPDYVKVLSLTLDVSSNFQIQRRRVIEGFFLNTINTESINLSLNWQTICMDTVDISLNHGNIMDILLDNKNICNSIKYLRLSLNKRLTNEFEQIKNLLLNSNSLITLIIENISDKIMNKIEILLDELINSDKELNIEQLEIIGDINGQYIKIFEKFIISLNNLKILKLDLRITDMNINETIFDVINKKINFKELDLSIWLKYPLSEKLKNNFIQFIAVQKTLIKLKLIFSDFQCKYLENFNFPCLKEFSMTFSLNRGNSIYLKKFFDQHNHLEKIRFNVDFIRDEEFCNYDTKLKKIEIYTDAIGVWDGFYKRRLLNFLSNQQSLEYLNLKRTSKDDMFYILSQILINPPNNLKGIDIGDCTFDEEYGKNNSLGYIYQLNKRNFNANRLFVNLRNS